MSGKNISRIKRIIENSKGLFIGVSFVKADGTPRNMVFRNGVETSHPAPEWDEKRKVTLNERNMLTIYDVQSNGFRTINLNTITRLNVRGKEFIYE